MKKFILALFLFGCAPTFQYDAIAKYTYTITCATRWRCIDVAEKLCNAVGYNILQEGPFESYTTMIVKCKYGGR